jgi:16S rRNA G527 N7-methylase RsmG
VIFYEELAEEYKQEAENIKRHIENLKVKFATEIAKYDLATCRRLTILNEIYLDLKYTGKFLESYKEEDCQ